MADTKKYGLIIKKKTVEKPLKKTAVFGNYSSDEEDVPKSNINVSLLREARKKKEMKQTQLEIEKALKEDPNVYEYDNIYDEMAEKKKAAIPKLAEKDRKPKYIKGLLESAKSRKMEDERRMERKIQKEREQEGGEFQEKEEFVTSAYRKRMIELQEEEQRLKKQEALDAANDVTKRSDLTMFYSNLLKQNVSMGGSFSVDDKTDNDKKETDDLSKDNTDKKNKVEKEDKTSKYKQTDSRKDSDRSRTDREEHRSSSSRHRDSDHHRREHERRRTSSEERSYRRDRDDKHRTSRKESEESSRRHSEYRRDSDRSEEFSRRHSENRRDYDSQEKHSRVKNEEHKSEGDSSREERTLSPKNETKVDISNVKEGEEAAAPSKFVKRSNNESISSARERFLERKRAREMMQRKQDDSDED